MYDTKGTKWPILFPGLLLNGMDRISSTRATVLLCWLRRKPVFASSPYTTTPTWTKYVLQYVSSLTSSIPHSPCKELSNNKRTSWTTDSNKKSEHTLTKTPASTGTKGRWCWWCWRNLPGSLQDQWRWMIQQHWQALTTQIQPDQSDCELPGQERPRPNALQHTLHVDVQQ